MRRLPRAIAAGLVAAAVAANSLAAPEPATPVYSTVQPGVERREIDLGGRLVAALAAAPDVSVIYLLVRPEKEIDGPRRLLVVRDGAPSTVTTVAESLGGWMKTLAAIDLGHGPELVAGGLGRLVSLGPLDAPTGAERPLLDHPGFDLRSLSPGELRVGVDSWFAAAEVGALRVWSPDGAGGLRLATELALPFRAERTRGGLELRGVPVAALPPDHDGRRRFAAGPEVVGARLRVVLASETAEGVWQQTETWSSLPTAETVEENWFGTVDGEPALLAHTQGATEINAFEDQRWRAFRLASDITRAGRGPGLAVTVDSKRWHDNDARFVDADGDGHDDAVIVRPEGLTGGDLVVEIYRGQSGGRFDGRSKRTDIDDAPSSFALLSDVDGRGQAGLVGLYDDRVSLWRLARSGRHALDHDPFLTATWGERKEDEPPAEGRSRWTSRSWLGAVPRAGVSPDLLIVADPEKGSSYLLVIRATSR